jgi:hypothetical protein
MAVTHPRYLNYLYRLPTFLHVFEVARFLAPQGPIQGNGRGVTELLRSSTQHTSPPADEFDMSHIRAMATLKEGQDQVPVSQVHEVLGELSKQASDVPAVDSALWFDLPDNEAVEAAFQAGTLILQAKITVCEKAGVSIRLCPPP